MTDLPVVWPSSLREINDLPQTEKLAIYHTLLATYTLSKEQIIHVRCPRNSNTVELSVYQNPQITEPTLYLHMGDTINSQIIVLMVVVNDLDSPRFNVDIDENGQPTQLGTQSRNIPEEIRAMKVGLAPGQVRRGLRIFRSSIPIFENFVKKMGHDLFFIEPLFYHNAVMFERYGFAYSRGLQKMRLFHQEFQPGGSLHAKLDGQTPFRPSDAWKTISGRSWALHDGILEYPFPPLQMYKRIGIDADICTFPNASW